jgi:predicted ester cyclase
MLTFGRLLIGALFGVSALAFSAVALTAPAQGACDESCLTGYMDAYLDALSRHDPSRVPTAAHYRFTENGAQIRLGEALWLTFHAFGRYRHDVADPQTGGIASYLSIMENEEMPFADLLAVRLKVVNRKITEIETVVTRHARNADSMPPKDPSWMQTMNRIEPVASRLSRTELKRGALGYLRAVAFHDGSLAPFAESCIRLENGGLTALGPNDVPPVPKLEMPPQANGVPPAPSFFLLGLGCGKQLAEKSYTFITGYEDARFPVVDEKRQIVYAVFDFTRRGNVESWTYEGRQVPFPEGMRYPNEILNTEMFKFVDGKITRVEAVFEGPQTYMRGTGWPGGTKPEARPAGD